MSYLKLNFFKQLSLCTEKYIFKGDLKYMKQYIHVYGFIGSYIYFIKNYYLY